MHRSYAEAVAGMTDKEAVRFLLDILERDTIRFNQRKCEVLAHLGNPSIAATPLAILISLWDSRGKVVTYDSLCTVAENEACKPCAYEYTTYDLVSPVKRLRKVIKREGWPIEINAVYGLGYRLDVHEPGWSIETKTPERKENV